MVGSLCFSVFFQVKWWAPGGLLVLFCVFPSKMVGSLYFSKQNRILRRAHADEVQMVFCRDILGATLLSLKFRRKPGPQQYLLLRIARRNMGWALENNLFGKITPYRGLCGIRKQSTVARLHSFGTRDAVGNTPASFFITRLNWQMKWLGSWT